MQSRLLYAGLIAAVLAIGFLDVRVFPDAPLAAAYAIPILIGAWLFPPRAVALLSLLAAIAGAANVLTSRVGIWLPNFAAVVATGILGYLVGRQRTLALTRLDDARESERRLRLLQAMVTHDLRSPLSTLLLQASIGERALARNDGERLARALGAIQRNGTVMSRLIADLVDLDSLQRGHFQVAREHTDLVRLVREVVADECGGREPPRVRVTAPPALPGDWDPMRLRQVLANLVSNACKYSPDGASVEVVVRADDHGVLLDVTDHGAGIDARGLPKLFQPYSRLDPEGEVAGVGLGLFIVKGIVEAHGGTIAVESTVGRGTTFRVHLPAA